MLPAAIIVKKRDGERLTAEEIHFMVDGFVRGDVEDYQMAAWAMAICWRGMDADETAALTRAMHRSGQSLPRPPDGPPRVDKHSTGGLGDKVSLILAPLLACCDVHVPMISGRGLGTTGGTLDKLEAIQGYSVHSTGPGTLEMLARCGCFIIGADLQIAPADRRLYALRDVTGTVESIALITASILSKKLAASLDALVMDVKVGNGAFMKTEDDADALAESLVRTGAAAGLPVRAYVTDMHQPLGRAVGNGIEVNEALAVLEGGGPDDVREVTLTLAAEALQMAGTCENEADAWQRLETKLDDGSARERFQQMATGQGGHLEAALPLHPKFEITAPRDGIVQSIDCRALGLAIIALGGGRRTVTDTIDHRVGLDIRCRLGDAVERGQPLAILHCKSDDCGRSADGLREAFTIGDQPVTPPPLIRKRHAVDA